MTPLKLLILGAIAMASLTIAMVFLRFWVKTRDRFFAFFAAAFAIMGGGRVVLGLLLHAGDHAPLIYMAQLLAFLLIIYAIVDKNRSLNKKAPN